MASEFITRVERDKDEPYTIIFRTDDADKYKHIENECRKMIGHAKPTEQPTVDAVPVVRCKECKYNLTPSGEGAVCDYDGYVHKRDWFCADGERKDGEG